MADLKEKGSQEGEAPPPSKSPALKSLHHVTTTPCALREGGQEELGADRPREKDWAILVQTPCLPLAGEEGPRTLELAAATAR